MPKKPNIKWRDKDVAELQRVVRNFNAKLDRVANKNPDNAPYLPSKLSVKGLKSNIDTRQEFKRITNSIKRFSRKGAEEIVTSETGLTKTKYEIRENKLKARIVNRARNLEVKQLGLSIQNGTMGSIENNNLKPKVVHTNKTSKEWDKVVESLDRELKSNFKDELAEQYKERYLQAVKNVFGGDGYELYNFVDSLDALKMMRLSISNPILSIDYVYEPSDMELEEKADLILNEWQESV